MHIPRKTLFAEASRAKPQVSPDGLFLSYLVAPEGIPNIAIEPTDRRKGPTGITAVTGRGIQTYIWAKNSAYILYTSDPKGDENTHIIAVSVTDATERDLTPYPGCRAFCVKLSQKHPDEVVIAHNRRDRAHFDVYRVNVCTGTEVLLYSDDHDCFEYYIDEDLRLRFVTQFVSDGQVVSAVTADGLTETIRFTTEDCLSSGMTHFFSPDGASVLLYSSVGRNTAALYRLNTEDGSQTLCAEDPRADLDTILVDPQTHAPLAVRIDYDRAQWVAIDPRVEADLARVNAQPFGQWRIASTDDHNRLWIIETDDATSAGAAYLYTRATGALDKLYDSRPDLSAYRLAPMYPVIFPSRDGWPLVNYLTLPTEYFFADRGQWAPLPLVLLIHGGPWGRVSYGYRRDHQWLANRGYAVLDVNFRTSTGFGKAFVHAGHGEWGRKMDDDLLDAAEWAITEKIADPQRIGLFGASYGGYATLMALARHPHRYACGVDIMGISNLETHWEHMPPYWGYLRPLIQRAIGDPATESGRALLRTRSPVTWAHQIVRPLLIAQGANDPRVTVVEADQMVQRLSALDRPVTYLLFPDEGHGFAREPNRVAFSALAEQFFARFLGGTAEPLHATEITGTSLRIMHDAMDLATGPLADKTE